MLDITGSLQVVLALLHACFLVFVLWDVGAEGAFFETVILNRFMYRLISVQELVLHSEVFVLVDCYDRGVLFVGLIIFVVVHVVGAVSSVLRRLWRVITTELLERNTNNLPHAVGAEGLNIMEWVVLRALVGSSYGLSHVEPWIYWVVGVDTQLVHVLVFVSQLAKDDVSDAFLRCELVQALIWRRFVISVLLDQRNGRISLGTDLCWISILIQAVRIVLQLMLIVLSRQAGGVVHALRGEALYLRDVYLRTTKLGLVLIVPLLVEILTLLITVDLRTDRRGKDRPLLFVVRWLRFLMTVILLAIVEWLPFLALLLVDVWWGFLFCISLVKLVDEGDLASAASVRVVEYCLTLADTLRSRILLSVFRSLMCLELLEIGSIVHRYLGWLGGDHVLGLGLLINGGWVQRAFHLSLDAWNLADIVLLLYVGSTGKMMLPTWLLLFDGELWVMTAGCHADFYLLDATFLVRERTGPIVFAATLLLAERNGHRVLSVEGGDVAALDYLFRMNRPFLIRQCVPSARALLGNVGHK